MADMKTETITGGRPGSGAHRVVALCGPYLSGKTSLLESILYATGAIGRRGSTRAGTSVGDGAAEARIGREYAGPGGSFGGARGSLKARWFPEANSDDYEVQTQVRAGNMQGRRESEENAREY